MRTRPVHLNIVPPDLPRAGLIIAVLLLWGITLLACADNSPVAGEADAGEDSFAGCRQQVMTTGCVHDDDCEAPHTCHESTGHCGFFEGSSFCATPMPSDDAPDAHSGCGNGFAEGDQCFDEARCSDGNQPTHEVADVDGACEAEADCAAGFDCVRCYCKRVVAL